jgi:hypothetical protein
MPTLIADACLLITLGTADALWLLRDLPNWTSVTCERAVKEVVRPPATNRVQAAIEDGWLSLVSIDLETDAERLALLEFDTQPAFRGRADAEVLAIAKVRGFTVGSDDRRVRREALRFGSDRFAGCVDLLVLAIRSNRIGLAQAVGLLHTFDIDTSVDLADLV